MQRKPFVVFFLAAGLLSGLTILPLPKQPHGSAARAASADLPAEIKLDAVTGEGMTAQAARADAFRNAISQAVGVFVRADTVVQDYVTKSDKIRTQSQGFIKSFKLLSESKAADGVISGTYQIVVSTKPLQEDVQNVVGAEFRNVGHPTVAVVGWFKGRDRAESEVNSVAVAALNRALINRGYKVVDASEIAALRKQDQEIIQASGAAQPGNFERVAQQIASKLLADIYVTTYGSVGQGKASVASKMYNSYTGQIFGSETGYGTMRGNSLSDTKKAVDDAISGSMQTILSQVSTHWQDVLVNGQEFVIVLNGFKNSQQRRQFTQVLEEASGVTGVRVVSAAGGKAEFSVHATASAFELFDEIVEMAADAGMKFVNDEAVVRGGRAVFILR